MVTINTNPPAHVGDLILYDNISDEEVINCSVSWALFTTNKQLYEMTLVPKLKAVPLSIEIAGVRQIIGEATVSTDGKIEASIDNTLENIKNLLKTNTDHFSIEHTKPQNDISFKNWLTFWMEGHLVSGQSISQLVDRLYMDLVDAQYKITKE